MLQNKSKNIKMADTKDLLFIKACEACGLSPTKRQYTKWQAGRGLAYLKAFGNKNKKG